ncbi:MAG: CD225/dispanin family protein [Tannerella sp.]|jgi:hypothetical protein|nr:CD225/dispanin family protein [Tannerella sp.]
MEKEYFYLSGETKIGPFSLEALKSAPISPSTLVWNNSLPDWVEACTLPELEGLIRLENMPPPPAPQTTGYGTGHTYNAGNTFANSNVQPPMPENYLVWAILTTVLCCMPLGIVSIIHSNKVASLYTAGDYAGALKASAEAKKWAMWSAISAGILWVLYIIVIVCVAIFGGLAAGLGDL